MNNEQIDEVLRLADEAMELEAIGKNCDCIKVRIEEIIHNKDYRVDIDKLYEQGTP